MNTDGTSVSTRIEIMVRRFVAVTAQVRLLSFTSWHQTVAVQHLPMPGNVAGLLLRFLALTARVLPLRVLEAGAALLVRNLPVFFVPLAVGFVAEGRLLADHVVRSIGLKSVTTPIAVEVALLIGGDPALTVTLVVATGIVGAMIGPWLLDRVGVRDLVARGLALGTVAVGMGTAQADIEGEIQGAVAGVAMGVGAVAMAIVPRAESAFAAMARVKRSSS